MTKRTNINIRKAEYKPQKDDTSRWIIKGGCPVYRTEHRIYVQEQEGQICLHPQLLGEPLRRVCLILEHAFYKPIQGEQDDEEEYDEQANFKPS